MEENPHIPLDITGVKFGRWTVIKREGVNKHRQSLWLCKCSCVKATLKIVPRDALKKGKSKSCGCLYAETRVSSATTHGGCGEPEYECWHGMMQRCYNPRHESYCRYGALGVTVQSDWHDYRPFKNYLLRTIGPRPSLLYTIDRFPRSGNYQDGRIRWATHKQQQRNLKSNVMMTYNGQTHCISEWTEILGWSRSKIQNRRRLGWNDDEILGTP